MHEAGELMARIDEIQIPDAKWGLLALLYSSPVVILFAILGDFPRGLTAGICAGILIGIVKTYWVFCRYVWFWVTIAVLAALHVPLVVYFPIPITGSFTVWELLPAAVIDFSIMYGCIKLVARLVYKEEAPESES
jgi:hypothetical protein